MKAQNAVIQLGLILVIFGLITVNLTMAWQDYQSKLAFNSDNPSGTNLAERYLILGDWPASKEENSAISQHHQFKIISTKNTESPQSLPSDK